MWKKVKEIICVLLGHKWETEFDPKQELKKSITERTHCNRCGIKYHKHVYKNN